jgi:TusA-related sulfurtransferase
VGRGNSSGRIDGPRRVIGRRLYALRTDYAAFMPGNDDGGGQICDLGVMGCNEVPMEFRRNMQALEVGATIQFVVRDPSAKEDLPPLARMMGHRIISEEHLGDGALLIVIERAR